MKLICDHCGKDFSLTGSVKFCPYCGDNFRVNGKNVRTKDETRNRALMLIKELESKKEYAENLSREYAAMRAEVKEIQEKLRIYAIRGTIEKSDIPQVKISTVLDASNKLRRDMGFKERKKYYETTGKKRGRSQKDS